jgi:hypothetical protein
MISQTDEYLGSDSVPLCIMIGKQIVPVAPNDDLNSQMVDDPMDRFTFVDGLVWQQNPDPKTLPHTLALYFEKLYLMGKVFFILPTATSTTAHSRMV